MGFAVPEHGVRPAGRDAARTWIGVWAKLIWRAVLLTLPVAKFLDLTAISWAWALSPLYVPFGIALLVGLATPTRGNRCWRT